MAMLMMLVSFTALMSGCRSGSNGEVYVYSYGDYFDPEIIEDFEAETGIKVIPDYFDTAEEMYTVLENGATSYDCVCTSDYMIQRMIGHDMLAEIDMNNIPDIKNLSDVYMKKSEEFDPGNKYSVPYMLGIAGILYNKEMVGDVEIDSWEDLWNEKFKDSLVMPDSVRDAFMIALKKLGYSENTTNEDEIKAAADELIRQKPLIYKYANDSARDLLANGSAAVGVVWNGEYIYTYRPEAYVSDLKWETTKSWNFGIDFGFLDNRISGSIDYYTRKTKDLLSTVPSAGGTNFAKSILTNVGNVSSQGLEITLNATPIQNKNWEWNLSYNMTWQKMKVTNLSLTPGTTATNIPVGPWIDSYQFQTLTEGCEPYMFYVYHQLYDKETGKPIEGAYADLNQDGVINSSDLYRFHSPTPDFIMGLSTSLRYKKLTLGLSFRANIGNYVYNGMAMSTGAWETVSYNSQQLNNLHTSYLATGFRTRQHLSDYYVENGSFLKLDNINLSYDFGKVCSWCSLTASMMIQNVFCITNYSGADPEVPNGMDNSFYPRPRTYSLSLGLTF